MIDMNKSYQTRDGRAVRVLCVDRNDPEYPVVFTAEDGELACCDLGGIVYGATESNTDLIEIKTHVVFWVNVPSNVNYVFLYMVEDTAKKEAHKSGAPYDIIARRVELPIEESEE